MPWSFLPSAAFILLTAKSSLTLPFFFFFNIFFVSPRYREKSERGSTRERQKGAVAFLDAQLFMPVSRPIGRIGHTLEDILYLPPRILPTFRTQESSIRQVQHSTATVGLLSLSLYLALSADLARSKAKRKQESSVDTVHILRALYIP